MQTSTKNNYGPFQIETLVNYYPTHDILSKALSTMVEEPKRLNIYLDLKNIMQAVYLEFVVRYLVDDTVTNGRVAPWIFVSFIKYIIYHKKWGLKKGIDIHFYAFFESGSSFFHLENHKGYKENRKIDQFYGLSRDDANLFRDVWQKNLMLIEKACHKMTNVSVIHLKRLEADFVPYYLMSRNLVESGPNILHMTYSTDHDLLQNTLAADNSIVFKRVKKKLEIIQKDDIIFNFAKKNGDLPAEYFPILMGITGDTGDSVPQVKKGLGPVGATKCVNEIIDLCGGIESIFENVYHKKALFENVVASKNWNKNTKIVVDGEIAFRRNLNLVSFECLCRNLDAPRHTNWVDIKKHIKQKVDENTARSNKKELLSAILQMGIFFENYEFDILMYDAIPFEERQNAI